MHPLPAGLATMPHPCEGVPSNPWCRPPKLSRVSMSPRRWRIGSALPHLASRHSRRAGATIHFTLSDPATVHLSFGRAHHRRLTLVIPARAGSHALRFSGRLSRHRRLRPGHYVLRITAADALGSTECDDCEPTLMKGGEKSSRPTSFGLAMSLMSRLTTAGA